MQCAFPSTPRSPPPPRPRGPRTRSLPRRGLAGGSEDPRSPAGRSARKHRRPPRRGPVGEGRAGRRPSPRPPARPLALLPVIELVLGARQRVNHEMDGRHGASFSSSSGGLPPPAMHPPDPFPSPKPTAAAAATSQSPKGEKQMRRGRCRLPAERVSAARRSGQEGGSTRHRLPRRQRARVRGRDPGRAAASGSRASGEGPTGEGGARRAAGCGAGVVPAADGVRNKEVGREMSPHRASLARSRRRRRQHRRRHLHFCPSFSVSQAPLPSRGGGANGRRRRREETGGRGHGCEGAGLRETGGKALSIGRLNVVGPRRCKARADWSVLIPSPAPWGWDISGVSVPESTC